MKKASMTIEERHRFPVGTRVDAWVNGWQGWMEGSVVGIGRVYLEISTRYGNAKVRPSECRLPAQGGGW